MGFDTDRFEAKVTSELLCKICDDVLEDGIQVNPER